MDALSDPQIKIDSKHLRRARDAEAHLDNFCYALGVSPSEPESCVLYLTYLLSVDGLTGPQLNARLGLIDLARRLDGRPRLRDCPEIKVFVRGLLRRADVGEFREQSDPIYREILTALIAETLRPTAKQARLQVAVLLCHHTSWPLAAIARLKWVDIDRRRADLTLIRYPRRGRGPKAEDVRLEHPTSVPSLRKALDRVAQLNDASAYVTFPPDAHRIGGAPWQVLKAEGALAASDGNVEAALSLVSRSPEQTRNRVAMILGYGAALTVSEALSLTQADVSVALDGLLLAVPGRRNVVGIPADPGTLMDPISAWEEWVDEVASWGLRDDLLPILLETHNLRVYGNVMSSRGVSAIVQQPADALSMVGTFRWQSLRWGAIRTAVRNSERQHEVASLANTSLDAVGLHYRRELLIKHSVAGQLGL